MENPFEREVLEFVSDWFSESQTVAFQTSGSTGTPKIIHAQKTKMRNSAAMTCSFLGLRKGESALLCLPVEYISGKMMVVRAIENQLQLHVYRPSLSPVSELKEKIVFCAMTPVQVENSLNQIHLFENLIIGGAEVSPNLKEKLRQQLSSSGSICRIYETYGMSETLSHIALKQIFPNEENYFKILPNIAISTNQDCVLQISAPKITDEILQTQDVVELKNSQEFRFLGRLGNVINSGGAKIFPEQLEKFIKSTIECEVAVVPKKDLHLGEKVVLMVEASEDSVLKERILKIPFEKKFHKPKEILFVEKFPRTPNGKLDRTQLLKMIDP